MGWLLFLSRLAFICGICFLITLGFAISHSENQESFSQTIIVIGYGMGCAVLPVTLFCYLIVTLFGRKLRTIVPLWLIISNLFFLFVLLFYIFYLNDPYYHKT